MLKILALLTLLISTAVHAQTPLQTIYRSSTWPRPAPIRTINPW